MLKLTTDKHEASCGLSVTAELLVEANFHMPGPRETPTHRLQKRLCPKSKGNPRSQASNETVSQVQRESLLTGFKRDYPRSKGNRHAQASNETVSQVQGNPRSQASNETVSEVQGEPPRTGFKRDCIQGPRGTPTRRLQTRLCRRSKGTLAHRLQTRLYPRSKENRHAQASNVTGVGKTAKNVDF